jgi:hypothetical protein
VFWRRRRLRIRDGSLDDLVRFLMKMDAKLDRILDEMGIDFGED